ncbi:alpha/beta fold hydrolase [Luteimonas sp. MJ293]|uniref:alpha/beta hydrolase family protein n=1 Tax=Luteimonas sp. MJ146 TaxID=3129240 RepID=UPI0031BA7888
MARLMEQLGGLLLAILVCGAATAGSFSEQELEIGPADAPLPATLVMPEGEGPFAAVVLVHGSGPHDGDGTIGPNHPLRDIAHGLAERRIATLRYDKRTKVYPIAAAFDPDFDLDRESTADTVTAVALLKGIPDIDPQRVFVFGHSLGAMLTPRIVERSDAAGGILFAAAARPLLDLMPEQVQRMGNLRGADAATTQASVDAINDAIARLRAGEDVPDIQQRLGASAVYFRSTEALDPIAEARALDQPLLVMHGGRDIQVTDTDWAAWQAAFESDPRVTLKHWPALGHLGIAADADDPLATYQQPGQVSPSLIDAVSAWIMER